MIVVPHCPALSYGQWAPPVGTSTYFCDAALRNYLCQTHKSSLDKCQIRTQETGSPKRFVFE